MAQQVKEPKANQVRQPEFNPQDPHNAKREPPTGCPLDSTCLQGHKSAPLTLKWICVRRKGNFKQKDY